MHQSEHPTYKLHLDTWRTDNCNPLIVDEDLPQALPPKSTGHCHFDLPWYAHPALQEVIDDNKGLFSQQLGQTNITRYFINTVDAWSHPDPSPSTLLTFQLKDMVLEGVI